MKSYSKNIYRPKTHQQQQQYFQKQEQRFNSNIFKIDFQVLKDKNMMAMGDPIFCTQCKAVLSSHSKTEDIEENKLLWTCEFCGNKNILENIEKEEIPKQADLCFMLQSFNQQNNQQIDQNSDIAIIFCVDFSGSMNATQELKGQNNNLKIDNASVKELEQFKEFMEPQEFQQYKQMVLQNQNKFISRKDCVMAAMRQQILDLQQTYPNRKIGLVTFNDEVVIIGDGTTTAEKVITGDKLQNFQQVLAEAKSYSQSHMQTPIGQSHKNLLEKFEKLSPTGQTALGPALLASLGLIDNAKQGSQIILCTDGLANKGFGALDVPDEELSQVDGFYQQIGQLAVEKGFKLNVITVKGEQCNVLSLGQIVESTSGNITRVNPINIHNDFASILQDEVIATQTSLKVWLHKGLKFILNKDVDENVKVENDQYNRFVGNVTEKTLVSFEYDFKSPEELQQLNIQLDQLEKLPFQAQIEYTSQEGHKMIRIITQMQEAVEQEELVHQEADIDVIQDHNVQINKKYALKGKFGKIQQQQGQYMDFINSNNNNYQSSNQRAQLRTVAQKESKMTDMVSKKARISKKAFDSSYQMPQQNYQQQAFSVQPMMMQQQQQQSNMVPPPPMQQQSQSQQDIPQLPPGSMPKPPRSMPKPPQISQVQEMEEEEDMDGGDLFGDDDDVDNDFYNYY